MRLTSEQNEFAASVAELCRREGGAREAHDDELYRKMAGLGWIGAGLPAEFGGADGGMVDICVFLEQTARGMAPIGGFTTSIIVAEAYRRFGSPEQKKLVIGGVAEGEVASIAMSEPEAGSDVGALTCRAERRDGGWVINGQKTWCSNAHIATTILLVARTSSEGGKHDGLTMFHVPADSAGLTIKGIETLGGSDVNDLYFTDCVLPADAVVGKVGEGWRQLMAGLNLERLILAAGMLGTAQRAFDDTLAYVRERRQFGKPIGTFQAIRHRLADLATEIECCRLLVYRVAELVDEDPERLLPREASMAKLKVTETAKKVALEGMQMMGGYGHAMEFDMQRHVRATLVSTVYGGTSEIQRDIIGKTYGL